MTTRKSRKAKKRPSRLQAQLERRKQTVLRELVKAGKVDALGKRIEPPPPRSFTTQEMNANAQRARQEAIQDDRVLQFANTIDGLLRQVPPGKTGLLSAAFPVEQWSTVLAALRNRPFHL